ncbi:hypothetical protein B0H14DRAFT_3522647 [Mycena olivaceomarginata]|nr:hypothetical protein B0H14DRAFT_3522647 [Mycena olivaceomarginata]
MPSWPRYSADLQRGERLNISWIIPKSHLHAHNYVSRYDYACPHLHLRSKTFSGTDGEGVEPHRSALRDKSSQKAKLSPKRLKSSVVAKVAHREACQKYRWKHRQAIKDAGCVSEEAAACTKAAHARYRAKKREYLAFQQRLRRQEIFITKHGVQAHRERLAQNRSHEDAAWAAQLAKAEEARLAARAGAPRQGSSRMQM